MDFGEPKEEYEDEKNNQPSDSEIESIQQKTEQSEISKHSVKSKKSDNVQVEKKSKKRIKRTLARDSTISRTIKNKPEDEIIHKSQITEENEENNIKDDEKLIQEQRIHSET